MSASASASAKRIFGKLVVIGDSGTGKTSLLQRYLKGNFIEHEATVGCAFSSKDLTVDGKTVHFEIWDTAGQERYDSLAPLYLRGASAVIVAYDISRKKSYDRVKTWVRKLEESLQGKENPNLVVVLTGNKSDLVYEREVRLEEAKAYAWIKGFTFTETSAKTGANVDEMFLEIARRWVAAQPIESQLEGKVIPERPNANLVTRSACCY